MTLFLPIAAFAGLMAAPSSVQGQSPAPDRAGEPELRRLMQAMHEVRNVHFTVEKATRNGPNSAFFPQSVMDAYVIAPTRFLVERSDMWGDAYRYAFDGAAFLNDPLSYYSTATVTDARGSIGTVSALLGPGGVAYSPLWLLLSGPDSLERLVPMANEIQAPVADGPWTSLRFTSPTLGSARILYRFEGQTATIYRIEYDELPRRQSDYRSAPDWYEPPDQPLTVETIITRPLSAFSVDIERLMPTGTLDQRKRGSS